MPLITDADWNGAMKALMPDTDNPDYDHDGREVPCFPLVNAAPYVGMAVDLWYVTLDITRVQASLRNTQFPPTAGPSEKLGQGTIVAVRYAPGRSGTLYPSVDVETETTSAARALRGIPSERRTAASVENGKLGGRPRKIREAAVVG